MRFSQSFMTELCRRIGPDTDVPAGDRCIYDASGITAEKLAFGMEGVILKPAPPPKGVAPRP
jgi:glutamate dehydrogenase/leucine dehydrogenase